MVAAASRVGIVVRTKDRPILLARALDDLLGQSFEDWTAVVVNDGGASQPVDDLIAERSHRSGDRIRAAHLDSSRGMEAASNLGVASLDSEFVAVHDDDDTWHPDFLADTVAHLDAHPRSVAVATATEIVHERVDGARVVELGREPFVVNGGVITFFDLLRRNQAVPISMLIRRTAIDEAGGFDPELRVVGDWEFNLRLLRLGPIDYLEGAYRAYWHQRPREKGVLGNSVQAGADLHVRYDRLVRDRAIRAHLDSHDPALMLFVARLVDERFDALEAYLKSRTPRAVAKRLARRILRRG